MEKDMVKVVFFVGLRRSRARVGTGGVESDDRGITRELILPSAGKPREPDWRRPIRPITAPRCGFIGF